MTASQEDLYRRLHREPERSDQETKTVPTGPGDSGVGMTGSTSEDVRDNARLVMDLVPCAEQERDGPVLALEVEEQVKEVAMAGEFLSISVDELRPSADIVAVPRSESRGWSDVAEP